jgi:hypothetical protein
MWDGVLIYHPWSVVYSPRFWGQNCVVGLLKYPNIPPPPLTLVDSLLVASCNIVQALRGQTWQRTREVCCLMIVAQNCWAAYRAYSAAPGIEVVVLVGSSAHSPHSPLHVLLLCTSSPPPTFENVGERHSFD